MKPVFDNRSCPQCGNRVSWIRLNFKASIWSKWLCPACGIDLCVDRKRRLLLAVIIGVTFFSAVVLMPRGMGTFMHRLPLLCTMVLYFSTFEKISLNKNAEPTIGQVSSEGAPSDEPSM
jgi:hypothetical protein